ncbi:protein-tyrosine phosphatase-like protein [Mycena galericulata]|nr:protein-tyrosine phosphatase-like protein [Mycena galericulata]
MTKLCSMLNPTADTQADRDQRLLAALGDFMRPRPIPNSYWATPHLIACEYPWCPASASTAGFQNPSKPKLDALLKAGVRTFIDLTECEELVPYTSQLLVRASLLNIDEKEIEYHRFPIRDRSLPESVNYMYKVMSVLRDNEERDRITAVHCRGGIGRTGMVIGCWLVESGLAKDGGEALEIIARKWRGVAKCVIYPHSPETGPQFEFVLNFHPEKSHEQLAF